jgi:hypothetical protein
MIGQTEDILVKQKDLRKMSGWKQVQIQQVRVIQEFMNRYNSFDAVYQPTFIPSSQAETVFRDRDLTARYSRVSSIQDSPDFWKAV